MLQIWLTWIAGSIRLTVDYWYRVLTNNINQQHWTHELLTVNTNQYLLTNDINNKSGHNC